MTECSPPIPDDLASCQAQLRAVLEQHASLLQRFHDLEHQLDETCTTTQELQRSYACLKEVYLTLKRLLFGPRRERLPEAPGQGHLFDRVRPKFDVKPIRSSLRRRPGRPTDRPSTRTDSTAPTCSSTPADSTPPPHHLPST